MTVENQNQLGSCGIVFIYFNEYEKSSALLESALGFEAVVDYGYAKMYKATPNFFIGAVNNGDKKAAPEKGATLCVTYDSLEKLSKKHAEISREIPLLKSLSKSERLPYHSFTVQGPEGYRFEFGTFIDPQQAKILNPVL